MTAFIDLTGQRFGRWRVEGLWPESGRRRYWRCRCDCGNIKRVLGDNLRAGKSQSCDCMRREICSKHNMIDHPAYQSWKAMKSRCLNSGNSEYKNYGGRGIAVCDRWSEFNNFWKDMGPSWKHGLSIERVNIDGSYELTNCEWATPKQQANNRRDNVVINTPRGRMNVMQAAKTFGLDHRTLAARVNAGWPEEDLLRPPEPRHKRR